MYIVREVVDPDVIEFALKGGAYKSAWPEEDDVREHKSGKREPRPRVSSRPDYIDTMSWRKMQYPTRLAIARDEKMRKEREAGEHLAGDAGESPSGDDAATAHEDMSGLGTVTANLAASTPQAPGAQPVIIEFCCAADSEVGNVNEVGVRGTTGTKRPGCKVVRISKEDCDILTPGGAKRAIQIAHENPGALLLTSLPCTAGCPWWHINVHHPGGKARQKAHERALHQMVEAWRPVAEVVKKLGGCIAWEWPRDCALWRKPFMRRIIDEFGLDGASFDGCAYGVKCKHGKHAGLPIKKPWVIGTDCPALYKKFNGKCCP